MIVIFAILSIIPFLILILFDNYHLEKYTKSFLLLLFITSLIPKLFFLFSQSYYLQGLYDIGGHLDYIYYFLSNFKIPEPYQCWECFQQPLYYVVASLIFKLLEIFRIVSFSNIIIFLQIFSFIMYEIFLVVSIFIFKQVFNKGDLLIASSILLFWPSGVIHSARIGNEVLLYLIFSLFIYYFIKWFYYGKKNYLVLSIIFTCLGLLTKSSGYILLSVLIVSYFIKFREIKKLFNMLAILIIILVPIILFNLRFTIFDNKQDNWLIGNWNGMPIESFVGNRLENFIILDISSFLNYANIIPGKDIGGRQYFWNYLIKTTLFGELSPVNETQKVIFVILSILILILISYSLMGIISLNHKKMYSFLPFIIFFLNSLLAMLFYRFFFPAPGANDFRYIYPSLVPFISFLVVLRRYFKKGSIFRDFYLITICIFISFSFLLHTISYAY